MAELKTQKDSADVSQFIAGIKDEQQRSDSETLIVLMQKITGESPVMWGKAMVGFGTFRYRGKTSEGDWFPVGFSPRKQNLSLYLHCILDEQTELLEKLGPHKTGKSCLYLKRLEDAHLPTLKKLIKIAYKTPRIAGAETVS